MNIVPVSAGTVAIFRKNCFSALTPTNESTSPKHPEAHQTIDPSTKSDSRGFYYTAKGSRGTDVAWCPGRTRAVNTAPSTGPNQHCLSTVLISGSSLRVHVATLFPVPALTCSLPAQSCVMLQLDLHYVFLLNWLFY